MFCRSGRLGFVTGPWFFSQPSEGLGLVARDISPSVFREALIRRFWEEHPKNFYRFEFAEIFEYETQERQQKRNFTGSVDSPFHDDTPSLQFMTSHDIS